MLRLDLAAMLRAYFPLQVARELSDECEALVRRHVEAGQIMRRVALTPSTSSRSKPKTNQ